MPTPEPPYEAKRYRKRPIEVIAVQYVNHDDTSNLLALYAWGVGTDGHPVKPNQSIKIWITKSSAWGTVRPGDWIIREPDGYGFYPCTEAEFERAYEVVP